MLGAACGAGAGGRTRSRCPWAQSVGAGTRHGSLWLTLGTEVSPLIPSPLHSPLHFMHRFVVWFAPACGSSSAPRGHPCAGRVRVSPPPCHLTRLYRLTYYPRPPSLGFWALSVSWRLPGGRGEVGQGGLIPVPTGFCAAPYHFHPSHISGFGEPGWGEAWEGSRVRFGVVFVVAFGPRVKLGGVCDVPPASEPSRPRLPRANPALSWDGEWNKRFVPESVASWGARLIPPHGARGWKPSRDETSGKTEKSRLGCLTRSKAPLPAGFRD